MRQHPRQVTLTRASRDITGAIHAAWEKYELSDVEILCILSEWQTSLLGRMRYSEWNPDEDSDEAGQGIR